MTDERNNPELQSRDALESRYKVISAAYEAAVSPDSYDGLVDQWGDFLSLLTADVKAGIDARPSIEAQIDDPELTLHFANAAQILRRTAVSSLPARASDLVNEDARPALVLSVGGRVEACNAAAVELFGTVGWIGELMENLRADDGPRIRDFVARTGRIGMAVQPTVVVGARTAGEPMHFVLVPRLLRDQTFPVIMMQALAPRWSNDLDGVLKEVFGLTPRERDLVRQLCANAGIPEIAVRENRSPLTLRTQVKAVLSKTGASSQVALMRMLAGLGTLAASTSSPGDAVVDTGDQCVIHLPDGRQVTVHHHGPKTGRPVVFVHGMLDGIGISRRITDQLHARGIRLIAPVRACFGRSDPTADRRKAPENFARDLSHVLDSQGVKRAAVVGHMAGSLYAFAAASLLPGRISCLLAISGGVPILSRQQFLLMSRRQKIMALTARFMPQLLPLLLNAGISQIRAGRERSFMEALYKDAPVDFGVASRDDVFPILRDGYQFTVAQGSAAFETDAAHVTRDWSSYVSGTRQPAHLVHGAHDPVVRIETVCAFAASYDHIRLIEHEGSGQLVFYQDPDFVLDRLEELLLIMS